MNRLIETTPNSKIETEAAQLSKAVRTIREGLRDTFASEATLAQSELDPKRHERMFASLRG